MYWINAIFGFIIGMFIADLYYELRKLIRKYNK